MIPCNMIGITPAVNERDPSQHGTAIAFFDHTGTAVAYIVLDLELLKNHIATLQAEAYRLTMLEPH